MNENIVENESDRFLRDGLAHFLPAVQALKTFTNEVADRIRTVLLFHDEELRSLGLVSSTGKLDSSPQLNTLTVETYIYVAVSDTNRSAFYFYFNEEAEPGKSTYVGFRLYTPGSEDGKRLFAELEALPKEEGYEIEEDPDYTVNIGKYVNPEQEFPNFQVSLDGVVTGVISRLKAIQFKERYGPGFRKIKKKATSRDNDPQSEA